MSILPYWVKVKCPYCDADRPVHRDKFEYPARPILVACDNDEVETCDKWFAVKAWATIEYATQLLSGE